MINKFVDNEKISQIVAQYGSPIYIYSEQEIINNINTLKSLSDLKNYKLNYATKANSNASILKIIKDHNMKVDATGMGEIFINKHVGFTRDEMYVVGNNFTPSELEELIREDVIISCDSLDQIKMIGELKPGFDKLMVRMNPSFGAGANWRVVTGGKNTKFGIDYEEFSNVLELVELYNLKLVGINQHIGSAYLEHESLIQGVNSLIDFIFENEIYGLEVIDFGGGFGLNYERMHTSNAMDMDVLAEKLNVVFTKFLDKYDNKDVHLDFEPGRYIVASAGILVGTTTSIKDRADKKIVGSDLGFTNFIRPTLYDSYHEVEFITTNNTKGVCDVVGNICESGDYIAKDRNLNVPSVNDLIVVYDTGAYGYCLSSNYNNRLKPCEVLIKTNGDVKVIRRRQTYSDLLNEY